MAVITAEVEILELRAARAVWESLSGENQERLLRIWDGWASYDEPGFEELMQLNLAGRGSMLNGPATPWVILPTYNGRLVGHIGNALRLVELSEREKTP